MVVWIAAGEVADGRRRGQVPLLIFLACVTITNLSTLSLVGWQAWLSPAEVRWIFERNYNNGGVVAQETAAQARTVTVKLHHDADHPSTLYVPIAAAAEP